MNNENILKSKNIINKILENAQSSLLESKRKELKEMIYIQFEKRKIDKEEYDILMEYIDNKVNGMLVIKKDNKNERDFKKEFREKVIKKIPSLVTKEDAYQILREYSDKNILFKEPVQEILKQEEKDKQQEFRGRIVKKAKETNKSERIIKDTKAYDGTMFDLKSDKKEDRGEEK